MVYAIDITSAVAHVFISGILDSLGVHRTIPLLFVKSEKAWKITLQVLLLNVVLLLGSLLVFHKGILKVLDLMQKSVPEGDNAGIDTATSSMVSHLVWMIFHGLWIVPIWILCYATSTSLYQELADDVYKVLKGLPANTSLTKSLSEGTYELIAWLFIYLQAYALSQLVPVAASHAHSFINILFNLLSGKTQMQTMESEGAGISSIPAHLIMLFAGKTCLNYIILVMSLVGQCMGIVLTSALYGWYGFNPHWISAGLNPDVRFQIIEKHWAYFVGFGAPYVILVKVTSFFVGYGMFLGLFPFCIVLGGLSDFDNKYVEAHVHQDTAIPPLRLFYWAQLWTLRALKMAGAKTSITAPSSPTKGSTRSSRSSSIRKKLE